MSIFKTYLIEKNRELLESPSLVLANQARFTYAESDNIQDMLRFYVKDRGLDLNTIYDVLADACITFESLSYKGDNESNHEDLVEVGYILGLLHSQHKGRIYGITFQKSRFYFIGVEADIFATLKTELNKAVFNKNK